MSFIHEIPYEISSFFKNRGYKNHWFLSGSNPYNKTLIVFPHRIIQGMCEKKSNIIKNILCDAYYSQYKKDRFKYDEFIMELIYPTIKEIIEKNTKDYYELQIEFCTASHKDDDGIKDVEDRIIKLEFNE